MAKRRTIKNFKILVKFTDDTGLVLDSDKMMDSLTGPIFDYIDDIENDNMAIEQEAKDNHE